MNNIATKMTPIARLAKIRAGYPFRGAILESPGSGIGVIQLRFCSFEYGIDWENVIETAIAEKSRTPWLEDGDVLFAARGGRHYAMSVRIPEGMHFKRGVIAAPHFYILRPSAEVLPEFLTWQLNSQPCQQYFETGAVGSYMKNVRRATLAELRIPLPNLGEQKKLIAAVDTLTQQHRNLQALQENGRRVMDAMATQLLISASRDGCTQPEQGPTTSE